MLRLPEGCATHTACAVAGAAPGDDAVFLFGGYSGAAALSGLTRILASAPRPGGGCASLAVAPIPCASAARPCARSNHAAVAAFQHLLVHGGHDAQRGCWLGDLHCASLAGLAREGACAVAWAACAPSGAPPSPRASHSLTLCGSRAYCFGGYAGAGALGDLHALSGLEGLGSGGGGGGGGARLAWEQPPAAGAPPCPRNSHSAVLLPGALALEEGGGGGGAGGTRILILGGHTGAALLNDVHVLDCSDPGALQWSTPACTGSPPPPLRGHSATLCGRAMVVLGGFNGQERMAGGWSLQCDSLAWGSSGSGSAALQLPSPRQRHSATYLGCSGQLLVAGGYTGARWLAEVALVEVAGAAAAGGGGGSASSSGGGEAALQDLSWLLGNGAATAFADCAVACADGSSVPAHRALLAARVGFFRAMWASGMQEAGGGGGGGGGAEQGLAVVGALRDYSRPTVLRFLRWVYTAAAGAAGGYAAAAEALALGDYLGAAQFKAAAEAELLAYVDAGSAGELAELASRHGAGLLLHHAQQRRR